MEDPWMHGLDPWATASTQGSHPRGQHHAPDEESWRNWQRTDAQSHWEANSFQRCASCDEFHNLWQCRQDNEYYCTACWHSWGWRDWDEGLEHASQPDDVDSRCGPWDSRLDSSEEPSGERLSLTALCAAASTQGSHPHEQDDANCTARVKLTAESMLKIVGSGAITQIREETGAEVVVKKLGKACQATLKGTFEQVDNAIVKLVFHDMEPLPHGLPEWAEALEHASQPDDGDPHCISDSCWGAFKKYTKSEEPSESDRLPSDVVDALALPWWEDKFPDSIHGPVSLVGGVVIRSPAAHSPSNVHSETIKEEEQTGDGSENCLPVIERSQPARTEWVEVMCPVYQQIYYWDTLSNQTTWEPPNGFGKPYRCTLTGQLSTFRDDRPSPGHAEIEEACVHIQIAWRAFLFRRAFLFQQHLAHVVILGAGKLGFTISARSWTEFKEQLEQCGIPQDQQHPNNFEMSGSIQKVVRTHPCLELVDHELWLLLQILPAEVRPCENLDRLTEIILRLHEPATVLYRMPPENAAARGSVQIPRQCLSTPVTSGMLKQIVSSQSFAPSPGQWHQKRAGVHGALHRITAVWGLPAAGSPCSDSDLPQSAEGLILAAAEDIGRTPTDVQEVIRRIVEEEWFSTVEDLQQITTEQWESMRTEMRIPRNLVLAIQKRLGHTQDMNLIGLNVRVGRAIYGAADGIEDLLEQRKSILIIGQPGTGKSTILREMTRLCAEQCGSRVVVVDTTSELGGFGVRPHAALGSATRVSVKSRSDLFSEMLNAVANLSAAVVVIDEIRDADEVMAARTIANEGVALLATAHSTDLAQLVRNPTLNPLLGGVDSAPVGDLRMRETRCASKFNEFRKGAPAFQTVIVIQDDGGWAIYEDVARAVDAILAAQLDDVARHIYPQARQGVADTDSSPDTGSTLSSSGSVQVQTVGVEKMPACLLARLCSGKTYLCCFDGGVRWTLDSCDAGAGACLFRVKTDGRRNEHLARFDRTVFMTDKVLAVDKAELAGMLAGISAFSELCKELCGNLVFVCEGDNKPLISHVREALQGLSCCVELRHAPDLQPIFQEVVKQLTCLKADGVQVWLRWRPRRFNKVADRLARQARLEKRGTWSHELLL